jgi:hypothetical protein
LNADRELVLRVDGVEKAKKKIDLLIARDPNDGMQIGSDEGSQILQRTLGKFRGDILSVQLVLGSKE